MDVLYLESYHSVSSTSSLKTSTSALNLLSKLIQHNSDVFTGSIDVHSVFRILSTRIAEYQGRATHRRDAVVEPLQQHDTWERLRCAEWRGFKILVAAMAKVHRTNAQNLIAAVRIVSIGALRDVDYRRSISTDRSTHASEIARAIGREALTCACCALVDCLGVASAALREAHRSNGERALVHEEKRLMACLAAMSPAFLRASKDDPGQVGLCPACPHRYVRLLLDALRRDADAHRLQRVLCELGIPFDLLAHVTLDISAGAGSSSERDGKHMAMLECFMMLGGFDVMTSFCHTESDVARPFSGMDSEVQDSVQSGDAKDWLFAFRWFAREARALCLGPRCGPLHQRSTSTLARLASEILCELPNERIPTKWPVACRRYTALILLQTCALEGMLPRVSEHPNGSIMALEGLLRPTAFSALLDGGLLHNRGGVVALLNLMAATYDRARFQLELPEGLVQQIVHYFNDANAVIPVSAHVVGHRVRIMLPVLAALPGTVATSKALCVCIERISHSDLSRMMRSHSQLACQVMRSLSLDDNIAANWSHRFWRAFVRTCSALGDALATEQRHKCNHGQYDGEIVEMLLPRVRGILLYRNQTKCQPPVEGDACLSTFGDADVSRAFAMIMLHGTPVQAMERDTVRLCALLLEHIWEQWKANGNSVQNTLVAGSKSITPVFQCLFWCLNATNAALGQAMLQQTRNLETAEVKALAKKALRQHVDSLVWISRSYKCATFHVSYDIALLVHILLLAVALKSPMQSNGTTESFIDQSTVHHQSTSPHTQTIDAESIAALFEVPLQALVDADSSKTGAEMKGVACRELNESKNARRALACWTLASLLELPATAALLTRTLQLRDLIVLRMHDIITSPLGVMSDCACEGACATLLRLLLLDERSRHSPSCMAVWNHFLASWLLSNQLSASSLNLT